MLLFSIEHGIGVHVLDLDYELRYLNTIILEKWNLYSIEDNDKYGPIELYQIVVDLPFNLHVLTSHGIYIFTFD